jgi:DNA modification methylase
MSKNTPSQLEQIKTADLVPYARNAKKHDEAQVAKIAGSIREFGFNNPVLIDADNGIIAGHGRVMAAQKLALASVPCLRLSHLSETQKRAYILADNRLAELGGGWDAEMLKLELADLGDLDVDLDGIGFGADDLQDLELSEEPEASDVDAEPQIDKAEELRAKWVVEPGQLWELGDHRLLCGDSTKKEDVEKALGGASPLLMVTDPPYGVEYDPSWRNETGIADDGTLQRISTGRVRKSIGAKATGKVMNDDRADWREAWQLFNGDVAYVWHAGKFAHKVALSLEAANFEIRSQIIWDKTRMIIGRGDYHWAHEPCWYSVRKNKTGHWGGDRKQTTIWPIPHRASETGHGTQKPTDCMARPIRNHDSEFVYEPFSGSGTTIIACEQLGRKCRAIEISPAYVAVALQRWADATGKTPRLVA